jgi:hypothetical protein
MKTILKKSVWLLIMGILIVSCKKEDTSPPTAPGSLSATDITGSTITLTWTASDDNEGIEFYNIWVGNNIYCSVFEGTSYVVKNLLPLTSYTFKVEAVDAAGNVSSAASVTASTILEEMFLSIFTSQTPDRVDYDGPWELGTIFTSDMPGDIISIRYYKHPDDNGLHTGKLWSLDGTLLTSVDFTDETSQGWQVQDLAEPYAIEADVEYMVSVNSCTAYAWSEWSLGEKVISNQFLHTVAGDNGTYGPPGAMPTEPWNGSNYYRDIVIRVGGE